MDLASSSSPRPWGCFHGEGSQWPSHPVFPTPVGVFLRPRPAFRSECRLPHARGGVSQLGYELLPVAWSSPRPWGCFPKMSPQLRAHLVFPTPVGVFPMNGSSRPRKVSLPHARGGVSVGGSPFDRATASSPRPWGCFLPQVRDYQMKVVFPTPVGVFPITASTLPPRASLPHARGGVSLVSLTLWGTPWSSPRPWGCFFLSAHILRPAPVFPTPVGVFLKPQKKPQEQARLPHARGGVSSHLVLVACATESSPRPWGCF